MKLLTYIPGLFCLAIGRVLSMIYVLNEERLKDRAVGRGMRIAAIVLLRLGQDWTGIGRA